MNIKKQIGETLMRYGIRPSVQRVEIYNYLQQFRSHPTVDEIFLALSSEMPTLSRTTIYNTLSLFADKGVAIVWNIEENNQHFDADMTPHAHFQCKKCGKIYDIPQPNIQSDENSMTDFEISDMQIYYKGICKNCKLKY